MLRGGPRTLAAPVARVSALTAGNPVKVCADTGEQRAITTMARWLPVNKVAASGGGYPKFGPRA
jgi:hypothetical protein